MAEVNAEAANGPEVVVETEGEIIPVMEPPVGAEQEQVEEVGDVVLNPPGDSEEMVPAAADEAETAVDEADAAPVAGEAEDVPKDAEPVVEAATEVRIALALR